MSGKLKRTGKRINVIDIVIILLILALVATGVYKLSSNLASNASDGGQGSFVLTFECEGEYSSLLNHLENGEAVYFASDGTLFGYLYDRDIDDARAAVYELTTSHPEFFEAEEQDESFDGYKIIKIGGQMRLAENTRMAKRGDHYIVEGKNLTRGGTFEVYTDDTVFTLKVISIEMGE